MIVRESRERWSLRSRNMPGALLAADPFQLSPLKANKGGPCSWPVVLDASPSIAVGRAQARVVAVPSSTAALTYNRVENRRRPFFIDGALSEDVVVRLLAFTPTGPPTVILCCADARGDQPASTTLIALGLDAARSSYQRWRVDSLAAAPRGLIPLKRGGCVVLFRHTF